MNRKITSRKSEIKSDARVQTIIRVVGLYYAGRPFSEIRRATGIDSSSINRYVRLLSAIWKKIQAPIPDGLRGVEFMLAVADDQTRARLAEVLR